MNEINTLDEALAWLQARGYNTDYRSPEPDQEGARRIDRMQYSTRYGKDVLHFEWCQDDAEVVACARRMQAEQRAAAAPDLLAACIKALAQIEAQDRSVRGPGAAFTLDALRNAIRKAEEPHG